MNSERLSLNVTGPFAPLIGILVGTLGGGIYWLAAQIWPSSVAVILAMTGTALLSADFQAKETTRRDLMSRVLCLLIKYNALMALSAAKLPFTAPANLPLALIMICGYAASFALLLFVTAARPGNALPKVGHGALILALLIGFAPAALLGIPGLVGLAAAVMVGIGSIAFFKFKQVAGPDNALGLTQLTAEACFYLGALASWRFV